MTKRKLPLVLLPPTPTAKQNNQLIDDLADRMGSSGSWEVFEHWNAIWYMLAVEQYGVNPYSELVDGVEDEMAKKDRRIKELESALEGVCQALWEDDDEGMVEHTKQMQNARAVLRKRDIQAANKLERDAENG